MYENVDMVLSRVLRDIQVELTDEFDKNFAPRQGFFTEKWQRRKSPLKDVGRSLLIDTGRLRGSIQSRVEGNSITFYTTEPYAGIHNDGGEIVVTERMKRYFWARCYAAEGAFGRRKDGSKRIDKRTIRLTGEAEFWKSMALKRVGTTIKIPRRRFLGVSPEVEKSVRDIIEENLSEYFQAEYKLGIKN